MNLLWAIGIAKPFSKCSHESLFVFAKTLLELDARGIQGDVVECGVWKGGIVILSRLISPQRRVWLFDTFCGMANRSVFDVKPSGYQMPEGKAAVSIDEVIANLKATGTHDQEYLRFVAGQVEITLTFESNLPDKIAMLHLDTDWYHSTRTELAVLWPRVQKKGAMIVDDFGHWRGSRKAVEEFFPPIYRNMAVIDKTAILMIKP